MSLCYKVQVDCGLPVGSAPDHNILFAGGDTTAAELTAEYMSI